MFFRYERRLHFPFFSTAIYRIFFFMLFQFIALQVCVCVRDGNERNIITNNIAENITSMVSCRAHISPGRLTHSIAGLARPSFTQPHPLIKDINASVEL